MSLANASTVIKVRNMAIERERERAMADGQAKAKESLKLEKHYRKLCLPLKDLHDERYTAHYELLLQADRPQLGRTSNACPRRREPQPPAAAELSVAIGRALLTILNHCLSGSQVLPPPVRHSHGLVIAVVPSAPTSKHTVPPPSPGTCDARCIFESEIATHRAAEPPHCELILASLPVPSARRHDDVPLSARVPSAVWLHASVSVHGPNRTDPAGEPPSRQSPVAGWKMIWYGGELGSPGPA